MLMPTVPTGNQFPMTNQPSGPSSKSSARAKRRLLLVDDNAEGRRALGRLLELHGFEVIAVATGGAAIEALRQTGSFEVILTDLLLPDADGREIAKLARSLMPKAAIVMITGWDFGNELRENPGTDVDLVFLKPLNVSDLVSKVNQLRPAEA